MISASQSWDWEKAKEAIRQFIRELGGQLQITLVRTSGEGGVELTNDPQILFDTLSTFKWLQRVTMHEREGPLAVRKYDAVSVTPNDGRRKVMLLVTQTGIKGEQPEPGIERSRFEAVGLQALIRGTPPRSQTQS